MKSRVMVQVADRRIEGRVGRIREPLEPLLALLKFGIIALRHMRVWDWSRDHPR